MTFSKMYFRGEETNTIPFNELILSWNGIRPKRGPWTFSVSLKEGEWIRIAEWGPGIQRSFESLDTVASKELCTAFRIKVEGGEWEGLHSLNVCVSNLANHIMRIPQNLQPVILKNVPLQSQMVLNHPRHRDLCSPTATAAALNYLLGKQQIDPVAFAEQVRDQGCDIYGNWVLNTAECYNQTGIPCHVARLESFEDLHAELVQGRPVVVSVKGTLPGAPKPYNAGHLICVVGYENGRVHCVDSAFATNEETLVSYDLQDFLAAWGVRRNLAYVFTPQNEKK